MKNRKVLNLRTHIAGVLAKTSYDSEKHKCDMDLVPMGVLINAMEGKDELLKRGPVLIPFADIIEAQLAAEVVVDESKPVVRLGRPPKESA